MTTETKTKTQAGSGTGNCWPPKAHIERKSDGPLVDGKLALCGAKLMGISLQGTRTPKVCAKCVAIRDRELGQ